MAAKRDEMIVQNLPLVSFVVGKMSSESGSGPIDRDDAVGYGVQGLIQAVDNYDPDRGTFASFAIRRIRGSILDAARRMDILPRSLRKSTRGIDRVNGELAATLGRWPTSEELAQRLDMPEEELHGLLGHAGARLVSLEKMVADRAANGSSPWEAPDPDVNADPAATTNHKASLRLLGKALGTLSSRDQAIVKLRYGRSMPFHEIGQRMHLSESRVCQLHKRILSSLRGRLDKEEEIAA